MRSLNNTSFQTNQNHPYFAAPVTDNKLSPLVSQYMDMFDASKVNASLLQKRQSLTVDDLLQHELQKKVKTLMGNPVNAMPNLAAMLLSQNLPMGAPFQNNLIKPEAYNIRNIQQQIQESNMLRQKQQQEALKLFQAQMVHTPMTFNKLNTHNLKTLEKIAVKEEYNLPEVVSNISIPKTKVSDHMSENNTTDSLSECSVDRNEFMMPSPVRDEPVLAEFTKAFPEWDLATIFSFLNSGKSMEAFEKERKFKMERKLKKQRAAKQNKTKKTSVF